jgi:hypothetical protein
MYDINLGSYFIDILENLTPQESDISENSLRTVTIM